MTYQSNISLSAPSLVARAKAVGRMVENTLILGADEGLAPFVGLIAVLRTKLPSGARRDLAWATQMACDDDEVLAIAETVLGRHEGAGWPLAPFDGVLEEALFWTDLASQEELEAYGLACLTRLSPEKRLALWRALEGRAAA